MPQTPHSKQNIQLQCNKKLFPVPENACIGNLFHYISIYMLLREIISANRENIAFIVGNGINRYPGNPKAISWDHLLLQLWKKFSPENFEEVPLGLSMTEFYDLLDIQGSTANYAIQKEAARLLEGWSFQPHHQRFMAKARELNAPVLTTNFDLVLPDSLDLQQYYTSTKGFSDFYPWTTYFGDKQLKSPAAGFGTWYINGLVRYPRSIRLGFPIIWVVWKGRAVLWPGGCMPKSIGKGSKHGWRYF